MVTRDFDAMLAEKAGIRPTFKIGGQQFTMKARLASKKFFALQGYMTAEDTSEEQALRMLFETVIVKADRDRFLALLDSEGDDDEDSIVDTEQLNELTEWITEFYTGKQKRSDSSSPPGVNGTGPQQNVVSLNARGA